MLFYRVCHRDHLTLGPYIYGPGQLSYDMQAMCADHSDNDTHPSARAIDGFVSGMFSCGFGSLEQLHEWFKSYESMLKRWGYVTRAWDVKSMGTDGFQCVAETEGLTDESFVGMFDLVSDEPISE